MNRARVFCVGLILGAGAAISPVALADEVLPQPATADRYLKMADRSPFAPPSAGPAPVVIPPPAPAGPTWYDQLSVALVTQEGGTYFATIFDKGKNEYFLLQSDKVDADRQLSVLGVQWGELMEQTLVNLRHNSDTAAVRFDPSKSSASASSAVTPGRPMGMPGPPPGILNQPRFTPPPPPPNMPGNVPAGPVQRRQSPIRTAPTVTAPANRPAPNQPRRPVATREDDEE